jgi:hypothetical protein
MEFSSSSAISPSLYVIRDMLLGTNYVTQGVDRALELAACCADDEAQWLVSLFRGQDVRNDPERARLVFMNTIGQNEGRVSFYRASLSVISSVGADADLFRVRMQNACDAGYAAAQAIMSDSPNVDPKTRFEWAKSAADQGERMGFYQLGLFYEKGIGCKKNLELAKKHLIRAADEKFVDAWKALARLAGPVERW